MISFDEVGVMLDEIAAELPKEIYRELNGGINLLPDIKLHPESRSNDFFILGEYCHDGNLGRYIKIYYGSFQQIYANLQPKQQRERLKEILMHEFVHHLESMAGERDLEIKDAQDLAIYKHKAK